MSRLAELVAPDMSVVSISKPEPAPRRHNVVAVMPTAEDARGVVVDLEALDRAGEDNRVAVTVMGDDTPVPNQAGPDAEGVTRSLAPRVVVGGLAGVILGGGLGALLAVIFDVSVPASALGGAALLGVFGAIWGAFARMGGSDAYRQTFTEPRARQVSLVSFHTDDAARADDAFDRLVAAAPGRVVVFDENLATTRRSSQSPTVG
jgi:hypothetical protein